MQNQHDNNIHDENAMEAKQSLIEKLCQPEIFPHAVNAVRVNETHSAWVICTGDYAYKVKKPVDFGFLDFSTLENRRKFCEKEIHLNSQFAPEIYLNVVAIVEQRDALVIKVPEAGDKVIEYAVKMRQFAEPNVLVNLAQQKSLRPEHIDQCIEVIANMHLKTNTCRNPEQPFGEPDSIMHWMLENFALVNKKLAPEESALADRMAKILAWVHAQQNDLVDKFRQRKQEGRVRECHGDLHLRNLTMVNGKVTPFDCIEFNDELRIIDVMSEIAFFIMDVAQHGYVTFANRFTNGYLQRTGDYTGLAVLPFYLVYRALVRAKVVLLRREQLHEQISPDPDNFAALTQEFSRYIEYAQSVIAARRPTLFITLGLSGSGKSTLAKQLCEQARVIQIRSDVERQRLFEAEIPLGVNQGKYRQEGRQAVYRVLFDLADRVLQAGFSVVLDATFLTYRQRAQAHGLAQRCHAGYTIVYCMATPGTLQKRIEQRVGDESEADLAVLQMQQQHFESLKEQEQPYVVTINTEDSSAVQESLQHLTELAYSRHERGIQ